MPTLNRHLAAAENLTSAFPETGRSDQQKLGEIKVRFRPGAVIRRPYLWVGVRVLLTDENLGEN